MGKFKDITGQRFGRLKFLCETKKRYRGQIVGKFMCDCGKIVFLGKYKVTAGHTKSCGCLKKEILKKGQRSFKNITGKRYGRLVVLCRVDDGKKNKAIWRCLCDCGETVDVIGSKLILDRKQSCGCLKKEVLEKIYAENRINRKGEKRGRLTAIEPTKKRKSGEIVWRYRCECGEYVFRTPSTVSDNTASCGCLQKEMAANLGRSAAINITGKRFGRLVAVKPTNERCSNSVKWLFKCDCGDTKIISAHSAVRGRTRSCGCYQTACMMTRFLSLEPEDIPYANIKVKQNQGKIKSLILERK